MAIHFYEESPSPPKEQLARLQPGTSLVSAGLHFVVWAEDALSIVHRVPTVLFDQQLLVPDDRVADAARIICQEHPYSIIDGATDDRWKDYKIYNPDRPYAFQGTPTVLMQHHDPEVANETEVPARILIHAASTFHFPIHDLTRTCLNPDPPSPATAKIRFPTLPAFYDALIDTIFEPPLGFFHGKFNYQLHNFLAYLSLYTVSDEGITKVSAPAGELGVILACLRVLEEVKDENRMYLARHFMSSPPVDWEALALERLLIKEARLELKGAPYKIPQIPYHPFKRKIGKISPSPTSELIQKLKAAHIEQKSFYDIVRRKWPSIFRGLRL